MYQCPAGHRSAAADYCDNCGRPISKARESTPEIVDVPRQPSGPRGDAPDPVCRFCATPYNPDDAFCEGCGHERPGHVPTPPHIPTPVDPIDREPVVAESMTNHSGEGEGSGASAPRLPVWTVRVLPDHDYFLRVLEWDGPDARQMQFPHEEEVLTLTLTGESMRIGRRNASVTSAPPEIALGDPGVSRRHAMLLRCGDGTWEVMDLGSANGTTINGGYDRVRRDPVRLEDGDRVHVGAWTTLEIRRV